MCDLFFHSCIYVLAVCLKLLWYANFPGGVCKFLLLDISWRVRIHLVIFRIPFFVFIFCLKSALSVWIAAHHVLFFQVVASLQAQLEQRRKEVEQKDLLFQNVSQETQNLRNQLDTVSTRCRSLEAQLAVGWLTPALSPVHILSVSGKVWSDVVQPTESHSFNIFLAFSSWFVLGFFF